MNRRHFLARLLGLPAASVVVGSLDDEIKNLTTEKWEAIKWNATAMHRYSVDLDAISPIVTTGSWNTCYSLKSEAPSVSQGRPAATR